MAKGGKRPGAGKKPGSKHSRTIEWEEFGRTIIGEGLGKALAELNKLKGERYLYHYEKFLSYFQPRATQTIAITNDPLRAFLEMTPEQRGKRILELQKQLDDE